MTKTAIKIFALLLFAACNGKSESVASHAPVTPSQPVHTIPEDVVSKTPEAVFEVPEIVTENPEVAVEVPEVITPPTEVTPPVTGSPVVVTPPIETPPPVVVAPIVFDTNVKLINFSSSQRDKILTAQELIIAVVKSPEFKSRVLNHTYQGKKTFVDNGGFTNEQIYQKILDGAEILQPAKNQMMDVEVELYSNPFTSTVGYTYPNSKRVWMNTKFFNRYSPIEVSDNLFHEWLHKLGFDHDSKYSKSRDYSVPYALGYLVEELAAKYYKK